MPKAKSPPESTVKTADPTLAQLVAVALEHAKAIDKPNADEHGKAIVALAGAVALLAAE